MTNLIDIQNQIEKLQRQANEIKTKEFQNTVQEILQKMHAFGITIRDLQSAKLPKSKHAQRLKSSAKGTKLITAKVARRPVAPKYRGPNGETWSGRGLTPRWLTVLIAQGQSKEMFAVDA